MLEISENESYFNPYIKSAMSDQEFTPDEAASHVIEVSTATTWLDLGQFDSITSVLVYNAGDNAVAVKGYRVIGTQAAGSLSFAAEAAGVPATITDEVTATFITNGAYRGGAVRVDNAATAANDNTYVIAQSSSTVLTLGTGYTVSAVGSPDATADLTFLGRIDIEVPAGGYAIIPGVDPEENLRLTTASGTSRLHVVVAGS
jgi:hypothetical protein